METVQPVKPRKWYEIWWDVWSRPGIAPFQTILNEPGSDITRGLLWIAITALVITLINSLSLVRLIGHSMPEYFGSYIFGYVCGFILVPIFAIIGIAISAGLYHLIAKLFGGNGKWSELTYCLSAVAAPGTLLAGVIGLISYLFFQIPAALFIPFVLSGVLAIYTLALYVNAIRAAENLGTGQAIGTVLIPAIIVGIFVVCVILAIIPVYRLTS